MGTIIAIINNKGGVGKSTVAVNLAAALGSNTRQILLGDMDAQCDATDNAGLTGVEIDRTLCGYLKKRLAGDHPGPDEFATYIHPTGERGVSIFPNHAESAWLESDLYAASPKSLYMLRDGFREYATKNYDYTILDTPPNMGIYVTMALIVADFVIVPVEGGSLRSVKGLSRAIQTIEEIRQNANTNLRFLRILMNRVDMRTSIARAVQDHLSSRYGEDKIFKTVIPQNTAMQQAEAVKKSILRYNGAGKGSQRFRALAKEVLALTSTE
ncbi:MAG: ParA family protein [Sphaerochaetaceae bacterium]